MTIPRRSLIPLATLGLLLAAAPAAHPPAVGDVTPDFTLADLHDARLEMAKLTATGPVGLVVLRGCPGYQCRYCTKQFADYMGHAAAFKAAAAQLVFVYPGPSADLKQHAGKFVNGKDVPDDFHLAPDPDYTTVNAYGLRWTGRHETADPSRFVVDWQGKVTFAKVSHAHGDRTTAQDALKALAAK